MKRKKLILFCLTICASISFLIAVPMMANAKRETKSVDVTLSDTAYNMILNSNEFKSDNSQDSLSLVTNQNPFGTDNELVANNGQTILYGQELSEADAQQYAKWEEGRIEYERKNKIINDLLNKYYPDEKKEIDELRKKEIDETIGIPVGLTESDIMRTELIVKVFRNQSLSNEEREICKEKLKYYYDEQNKKLKFSEDLNGEVEKIIN